jgi:hypothetical protein
MKKRHSWTKWVDVTSRLERTGKLSEVDRLVIASIERDDLYNEMLRISDTIEELVVLSHYSGSAFGYLKGYKDGITAARVPGYIS